VTWALLVKSLLDAITQYLALRKESIYYDVLQKSRKKQKELKNEIEKLRNAGTNTSADNADVLRNELIEEQKFFKHLSTVYSKPSKGAENTD